MNSSSIAIVGAGLAGLIAAHAWPTARIFETQSMPRAGHTALLRFRTDAVARLTGIEFNKVRVRKGIWSEGNFVAPDIRLANCYSLKTLGKLVPERSIWNLEPVERWIAPETLYAQLVESVGHRVTWGAAANYAALRVGHGAIISTAPLPDVISEVRLPVAQQFHRAAIAVGRWRVPGADVHQTVYFPDRDTNVYRASITGDLLIQESVSDEGWPLPNEGPPHPAVLIALGLYQDQLQSVGRAQQRYGKIAPIDEAARKTLVHQLTVQHGIFSLGRFATWRNLLLDDVVDDIAVIKRLLRSGAYDLRLAAS